MLKVLLTSGRISTGADVSRFFNSSKLAWHSDVHLKSLLFSSNLVVGLAILKKILYEALIVTNQFEETSGLRDICRWHPI
jgi:hypothetical protein